jgi:hypothetical protein
MQVFLGDEVTLLKEIEPTPTYVTGQVAGVVLDNHKGVERIYIHGIDAAFWMHDGWKFVDMEEEEDDEI